MPDRNDRATRPRVLTDVTERFAQAERHAAGEALARTP